MTATTTDIMDRLKESLKESMAATPGYDRHHDHQDPADGAPTAGVTAEPEAPTGDDGEWQERRELAASATEDGIHTPTQAEVAAMADDVPQSTIAPVEHPFPRLAEYERLANAVQAARTAHDRSKAARVALRAEHAKADATATTRVQEDRVDVSTAEQALGEFIRDTGMGDPEGVLKGTGQRLTKRRRRAAEVTA